MLKARIRRYIALVLVLAFSSQTMATAAMSCEPKKIQASAEKIATTEVDMSAMDPDHSAMHRQHHKTASSHKTHQQFNCCKTMGQCLSGGCMLAIASHDIIFVLNNIDSAIEDFYSGITPSPLPSSPYRPPIFC